MNFKSDKIVSGLLTASQEARAERRREIEQAKVEGKALADAEAKAIEERTARLKALRLAKEAAEKAAAAAPVASRKKQRSTPPPQVRTAPARGKKGKTK